MDTDLLRERSINFEVNGGYNQDAMPEVYTYYKDWIASGKYPYLRQIREHIEALELIPNDLQRYLETEVFLASHQHDRERAVKHEAEMRQAGWDVLTPELCKALQGKQIQVNTTMDGAIFTHAIDAIYKPVVTERGCFLMKPRARSKGLPLSSFDKKVFYKVVGG